MSHIETNPPRTFRFALIGSLFVLLLLTSDPDCIHAQTSEAVRRHDTQLWHDLQLSFDVHHRVELIAMTGVREGGNVSQVIQDRIGGGLSLRLNKFLSLSPMFALIDQRPTRGQHGLEKRVWLDATVALPAAKWLITNRNRIERRFQEQEATRYRNRVQVERPLKLGGFHLKLFASEEIFHSWSGEDRTRLRLTAGGTKKLGERTSLDVYFTRQRAGGIFDETTNYNAIGTTLKVRL